MCLVKKPKVAAPPPEKEAAILRNPYLDGLDPILRARSGGVRSLTIRRDQTSSTTTPPRSPTPTVHVPNTGGGGTKYPGQATCPIRNTNAPQRRPTSPASSESGVVQPFRKLKNNA